jgi:bile acid:Na+ symporter, BASS family
MVKRPEFGKLFCLQQLTLINMKKLFQISLILSCLLFIGVAILAMSGNGSEAGIPLSLAFFLLSLGIRLHPFLKGFTFTVLIFSAVSLAMFYPGYFVQVGTFKPKVLIIPLLQIIMFGMGTTMSMQDFLGVLKMPKAVLVGLVCQFTIMPFLGFGLAKLFNFPPEIAAGVILIGCAPSGLASNVMSYIANANVPLSVTLTAIATLAAPFITPFLMQQLAGQYIPIDLWKMMLDIAKMVILPIGAGLLFNYFFHGKAKWLDLAMPIISMAGIAIIVTVITANGRDGLLQIGFTLILAAILHNVLGYFLGYLGAKLVGLNQRDCRTIAIEVGMQNGGLASGIALTMNKIATVGLAPAVFGPWMNISGSSLATWWRSIPIKEDENK